MKNRPSRFRDQPVRRGCDRLNTPLPDRTLPLLSNPLVETDLLDYAPGATATITASSFATGETVAFQVLHIEPGLDGRYSTADDLFGDNSGQGHLTWFVTDGGTNDLDGIADGIVVTQWYVNPDDSEGATFQLTATGQQSSKVATTLFTDATISSPLRLDTRSTTVGTLADGNNTVIFSQYNGKPQGTGAINSFLQLSPQGGTPGQEAGFNTTGIRLTTLANSLVQIGGKGYYEFRLDLNESTSNPKITLNTLQIYTSSRSSITSQTGLISQASKILELQGAPGSAGGIVQLDASIVGGGSGVGDLLFYIPQDAFLSTPNQSFVYLYAALSGAEGGFEEFSFSSPTLGATIPTADLSITKDDGKSVVMPGTDTTYTITVTNKGSSSPLTSLTLVDTPSSGLQNLRFSTSVGTYNPATGVWSGLNLGSNQSITLTVTGTVSSTATGTITNSVTVTPPTGFIELNSTDNQATDTNAIAPPLSVSITFDNPAQPLPSGVSPLVNHVIWDGTTQTVGGVNYYGSKTETFLLPEVGKTYNQYVHVANTGNVAATDVVVDLRASHTFVKLLPGSITSSNATLTILDDGDNNDQTVRVRISNIAANSEAIIRVTHQVTNLGNITPLDYTFRFLDGPNPDDYGNATAFGTYYIGGVANDTSATPQLNTYTKKAGESVITFNPFQDVSFQASLWGASTQPNSSPLTETASLRILRSNATVIPDTPTPGSDQYSTFSFSNLFDADTLSLTKTSFTRTFGEAQLQLLWDQDPDLLIDTFTASSSTSLTEFLYLVNQGLFGIENATQYFVKPGSPAGTTPLEAYFRTIFHADETKGGQSLGNFAQTPISGNIVNRDAVVGDTDDPLIFSGGSFQAFIDRNLRPPVGDPAKTYIVRIAPSYSGFNSATGVVTVDFYNYTPDRQTIGTLYKIQLPSGATSLVINNIGTAEVLDLRATAVEILNSNGTPKKLVGVTVQGDRGSNLRSDKIIGTAFDDVITGANSRDTVLEGFLGNDTLVGGNGRDILIGGQGVDTLDGGRGPDTFVYRTPYEGADTILNLEGNDVIQVSRFGFSGALIAGTNLSQASSGGSFVAGSPTTSRPTFIYNAGVLSFDRDGNGSAAALVIATLAGSPALNANQIVVV